MSEAIVKRESPVINKRAFIYMFKKNADGTFEQVQVGQFEDWGMSNNVNTIQYLECGYVTALNIPLDYSFGGYLSKGALNSRLIALAMNPNAIGADKTVANGTVFQASVITPYAALPKCKIKLVMQYSNCKDDTLTDGTEISYEYDECVLFNHRIHNARGIVTESLSFVAESLNIVQQAQVANRGKEV